MEKILFSPMNIGSLTIKNRVVMPAMMLGHGQFDGTPTRQMLDYYEERAKGGAGLIITEITRVDDLTGAGALAQLGASHDYHIAGLSRLANRIHKHDCKIFVQLHHPGRQNMPIMIGTLPLAVRMERLSPKLRNAFYRITPAARKLQDRGIVLPVSAPSKTEPCRFSRGRNRALSQREVKKLVSQFVAAATRVQAAGCDGVELHGAHGYLIQQFLSPYTNRRTDAYGGNLENRMRFLLEIIEGIRRACGSDFPISVRLSVDECYDRIGEKGRGYGLAQGLEMAKILEEAGIDALNISSASYETMNYWLEPVTFEPGWRKHMARAVKERVSIPVIAANLILSPKQAEAQLRDGIQDFAALGWPHLADPHWTRKVREGRETEIKRCIGCLWCFESMLENAYMGTAGECAVNPWMGKERLLSALPRDGEGRKVIVVGAGPAGLTAAEILCDRGFAVYLYERQAHAGGQAYLASLPPGKQRIAWCFEDLQKAVIRKGGRITFHKESTASQVLAENPYAVIVATGGSSLLPESIAGIKGSNVRTVEEVLTDPAACGNKKVAVIGSGMTGLEAAETLASHGSSVLVVEMADAIGPGVFVQHLDDILPRLKALNVEFLTGHKLTQVREHAISLKRGGSVTELPVDLVVPALGIKRNNTLYNQLKEKMERVFPVGDACAPGRIANATRSAAEAALRL